MFLGLPDHGHRCGSDVRGEPTAYVVLPPELMAAAALHVRQFVDYAQPYFHRAEQIAQ